MMKLDETLFEVIVFQIIFFLAVVTIIGIITLMINMG
jgi:hypothetical protein